MNCREQARNVLNAWNQGSRYGIATAMVAANGGPMSSEDEERAELLHGIVDHLQISSFRHGDPSAAVPLRLLRHLARGPSSKSDHR